MTKQETFYYILAFYAVITYLIFPIGFYYYKKTLQSAGDGFVVGSLISVILWTVFGSKLV